MFFSHGDIAQATKGGGFECGGVLVPCGDENRAECSRRLWKPITIKFEVATSLRDITQQVRLVRTRRALRQIQILFRVGTLLKRIMSDALNDFATHDDVRMQERLCRFRRETHEGTVK